MNGPTKETTQNNRSLPIDSDVDSIQPRAGRRAIHLHPGYVGLVILGGVFGTLARYGLEAVIPTPGDWPLSTLLINLAGAFALGALLEGLVRCGRDLGRLRIIRLVVGTGFLGSFTTYSTLAVEASLLLDASRVSAALLYLSASVIGGACVTTLGIWVAAKHHRTDTQRNTSKLLHSAKGKERS